MAMQAESRSGWKFACSECSMLARLGFVASVLSENISTSRTCRLKNATELRIRELITENLNALERVITFLERQNILLYRITSNLIPFASHPINALRWWDEFAPPLMAIGRRFRMLGVRVSTHPGQFTVLNSPTAAVVKAAVAELEYHARLLDVLGTDTSAKIIVHVGGLYAGSEALAMDRFCAVASELPPAVRQRLVVENDDRLFDAEEVLSIAHRVHIPVVFDWLHHNANACRAPLTEVLPAIFATWKPEDGRPKVHLSSQAPDGPLGAHADFVEVSDALAFFEVLPPQPFDCMLEAKQKDRAVLKLRAALRRRGIVETDVLVGATRRRSVQAAR
jgi:UV DNA damage endonuclease